jgi:hypothetical protein
MDESEEIKEGMEKRIDIRKKNKKFSYRGREGKRERDRERK